MLNSLQNTVVFFLGLFLLASMALAADTSVIQGDVKGPNAKPIQDAQVTIALKDATGSVASTKTDRQGHYMFKGLPMARYNISISATGMAATTAADVKPRADSPLRVDFNLKQQSGSGRATSTNKKRATRMVWIPAQTGSNLGGRWVEVDENGSASPASADNLTRARGGVVTGI